MPASSTYFASTTVDSTAAEAEAEEETSHAALGHGRRLLGSLLGLRRGEGRSALPLQRRLTTRPLSAAQEVVQRAVQGDRASQETMHVSGMAASRGTLHEAWWW